MEASWLVMQEDRVLVRWSSGRAELGARGELQL